PIVVARDLTILAGHGTVQAAAKLGRRQVPVLRLDLGPNDLDAKKILVGDNEIGNLAIPNDLELKGHLEDLNGDWIGTGFDKAQFNAFRMLTRPPDALIPKDEMAEWDKIIGIPYKPGQPGARLNMQFRTEKARQKFVKACQIQVTKKGKSA